MLYLWENMISGHERTFLQMISMTNQDEHAAQGARKYYSLEIDFNVANKVQYPKWVNKTEQMKGFFARPDQAFRGLVFSEPPRFRFERKRANSRLLDAESITLGIWLVSDRVRVVFEKLDPEAFVFQKVEIDCGESSWPGPDFWLVDILRTLDCIDEERSVIRYQDTPGIKAYAALIDVRMRPEVVGTAHAFRLAYATTKLIVDDVIVAALKAEKIRGFEFEPIQR